MNKCLAARAGTAILALAAASAFARPPVVNPEQLDTSIDINAKIGLEKAKRNSAMSAQHNAGANSGSGCGTVNINSNDNKSNSGIKGMFGKQTTTIVTGPVINMANCN